MWYNVADSNYHQAITHLGRKCALSSEPEIAHRIKQKNAVLWFPLIKCCKARDQCLKFVIYNY